MEVINKFKKINYAVVDIAIQEGWSKQLAYYLHITTTYNNSVIYNYSCRTLAEKLNVSKSAVHSNVNFLINKGLLSITDKGHLVGLSNFNIRNWASAYLGKTVGKGKLTIKVHESLKLTEYNILSRVVLNNLNRQKFSAKKRAEVNAIRAVIANGGYISSKNYKKYKESLYVTETKKTEKAYKSNSNETCFVSDSLLSKLTGKSIGTVRNMIKFWKEWGLISATFIKGLCVGVSQNRFAYQSLVEARPLEFSNTYFFKNKIVQFNKRVIEYGSSLRVGMNPNSI